MLEGLGTAGPGRLAASLECRTARQPHMTSASTTLLVGESCNGYTFILKETQPENQRLSLLIQVVTQRHTTVRKSTPGTPKSFAKRKKGVLPLSLFRKTSQILEAFATLSRHSKTAVSGMAKPVISPHILFAIRKTLLNNQCGKTVSRRGGCRNGPATALQ